MTGIIFDEHQYAVDMNNGCSKDRGQNEKRAYNYVELSIYAKWLYWNIFGTYDEEKRLELTKNTLIQFCNDLLIHFNENSDYPIIESILKNVVKSKLRKCLPCHISKDEWNDVMSLPDDKSRRTYFTCLVLVKYQYLNFNNPNKDKYEHLSLSFVDNYKILKYAGVKFKTEEKKKDPKIIYSPFLSLSRAGLIEANIAFNKRGKGISQFGYLKLPRALKTVSEEDIYMTITKYDDIEAYYLYGLHTEKYKICEKCGRAFKKNNHKNNDRQCKFCKDTSIDVEYKVCVDCGKRFALINHKDKIQDRCEECKKKWQKERNRLKNVVYRHKEN